MKRDLNAALATWIADGFRFFGEVLVTPLEKGGFELRHRADVSADNLSTSEGAPAARPLSFFTDAGDYRPLKTAPTLKRGWRLLVASVQELRDALDHFYPAMTGLWLSHLEGALKPVSLRETLNRQTGMYAATKRLQDAEGQHLVGATCQSQTGCLKRKLWAFDAHSGLHQLTTEECSPDVRQAPENPAFKEMPLLCHEACNLLVAACREVVKTRERASQAAQS